VKLTANADREPYTEIIFMTAGQRLFKSTICGKYDKQKFNRLAHKKAAIKRLFIQT